MSKIPNETLGNWSGRVVFMNSGEGGVGVGGNNLSSPSCTITCVLFWHIFCVCMHFLYAFLFMLLLQLSTSFV